MAARTHDQDDAAIVEAAAQAMVKFAGFSWIHRHALSQAVIAAIRPKIEAQVALELEAMSKMKRESEIAARTHPDIGKPSSRHLPRRGGLAARIFSGACAQSELEKKLSDAGVRFERLGWDHYDCSLEIYGVPAAYRLSEEAQLVIHAAGFVKAYVNHDDKWETHYDFEPRKEFETSKGWRVSYPRKRGPDEKGIWVEEFIPRWPKAWFDTGYVLIKQPVKP